MKYTLKYGIYTDNFKLKEEIKKVSGLEYFANRSTQKEPLKSEGIKHASTISNRLAGGQD